MPDDTGILERIGEQLGSALGDGPPESRLAAQKRDFVSMVAAERQPRRFKYFALAMAASLVLATVGAIGLLWNDAKPIKFWVGERLALGSEGTWVEPSDEGALPIRFEGGTRFELQKKSAARVVSSNEERVELQLKSGEIHADVNGNGRTRWVVDVGPYQVHVMGTIFTTFWDEAISRLEVSVERGSVVVRGEGIGKRGTNVTAGDRLRIDKGVVTVSVESAKTAKREFLDETEKGQRSSKDGELDDYSNELLNNAASYSDADDRPTKVRVRENPRKRGSLATADSAKPRDDKTWKDYYEEKDFDRAIAAAKRQGLGELMANLNQEDLWQLANAARYAGEGKTSSEILLAIRRRFAGYRRAEAATFLLGRVALELERNPAKARKWFDTYLVESPNGSLSEEALGRLIDACEKSGRTEQARQKATLYLTRYPNGLFAEMARSVLNK